MKLFWQKYRYPIILLAVLFVAELLVQPVRDFPLNDDWSYSKSVKILLETEHFNIGNWGAMTLITQILWGFLWTKTFGFSFIVLRLSTIFSAWIGVLILFLIGKETTRSNATSFWMALCYAFLPIFFNLSNTFMTDVNFCTLLFFAIYYALLFFKSDNRNYLLAAIAASFFLTFLRQYGIVVPIALIGTLIFKKKRDWIALLVMIVAVSLLYGALRLYEYKLKSYLAVDSAYKFSSGVHPFDVNFYTMLSDRFAARYKTILIQLLVYGAPISFFFLLSTIRSGKRVILISSAVISLAITTAFLTGNKLLMGNVWLNMWLGPETMLQNWEGPTPHFQSDLFEQAVTILQFIFAGVFLFVIIAQLILHWRFIKKAEINSFLLFIVFLFFGFLLMILITESYFDRYHLPIIALITILFSPLYRNLRPNAVLGFIALLPLIYCSVAGTHDYFEMNEKRWEAYHYLREHGVGKNKINGGFEINCWAEGDLIWWDNILDLKNHDYLIQFEGHEGFEFYRAIPYQCWYPPRTDKISIYKRVNTSQP